MSQSGADKLSVAIIGCGQIAGGYDWNRPEDALPLTHAAAYRRDEGFRLVACVDPDRERAVAFAARWGAESAFTSMDDLVPLAGQIDVISICSPTDCHLDHGEAALALKPRLIFCEKPMTPDMASSRRLVARAAELGILLAVNHNRRWDPEMRRLACDLANGKHGALRSVVATYNKGVLNNGSHMIDLLHMLLGPLQLIATGRPIHDFRPDDPTVPALLENAAGVPVHLATAHAADYAHFELVLTTASGILTMRDSGRGWRERVLADSIDFPGYRVLAGETDRAGGYDHASLSAAENIRLALTNGEALASDGATALAAQELCALIHARALEAEARHGQERLI